MTIATVLSFAQAPILALLVLMYLKQKFKIQTLKYLIQAFGLGLLSVLIFVLIDLAVGYFGYDTLKSLKRSVFYSFVVIGFGSQLGIFIMLRFVFLKMKRFTGPIDGILYGIMISLGFSTLAVPLFTIGMFSNVPVSLYLYTLPVAALLFSIIMGFFTGMGKYRKNRLIDSMTGLGASSFFMGFYYFAFLTKEDTILILYSIGIFIISMLLLVKAGNVKPEIKQR
ncbi:MAG: hypothetical protein KJ754_13145 [Bacteroidetes bacterium]|nr:hypothetical protein [Bacteroidota bacterium]MBU1580372.1 hypothetical protein [Bacteroidota bacterium]